VQRVDAERTWAKAVLLVLPLWLAPLQTMRQHADMAADRTCWPVRPPFRPRMPCTKLARTRATHTVAHWIDCTQSVNLLTGALTPRHPRSTPRAGRAARFFVASPRLSYRAVVITLPWLARAAAVEMSTSAVPVCHASPPVSAVGIIL